MGMLTVRLIRSKRMLKARKKLNYEGKNRGHDYLDLQPLRIQCKCGCESDVAILSSCILIFIARFENGHCTTCNCTYGYEYGGPATYQITKLEQRDQSINIPNPSEPSCDLSSA
jgi:hypothetical protein